MKVYTDLTQHTASVVVKRKKVLSAKIVWHCETLEKVEFETILSKVILNSSGLSKEDVLIITKIIQS